MYVCFMYCLCLCGISCIDMSKTCRCACVHRLCCSQSKKSRTQHQRVALLEKFVSQIQIVHIVFVFDYSNWSSSVLSVPGKATSYDLIRRFRETGSDRDRPKSGRSLTVTKLIPCSLFWHNMWVKAFFEGRKLKAVLSLIVL